MRRHNQKIGRRAFLRGTTAASIAALTARPALPAAAQAEAPPAMRHGSPGGDVVGLSGPDGFPSLWLGPLVDAGSRPVHLALAAPSREAVDEVFAAAQEAGAEILHPPRIWPEYHQGYYGVFFRDPDGNNVEAVHHTWTNEGAAS